jgi:hypothetical protein
MELGKDYQFRDDKYDLKGPVTQTVPIELLLDSYKGIIYRYTTVAFDEETEQAKMKFTYEIIDPMNYTRRKLQKDKKFQEILGLILNTLILEALEANGETGTHNTAKPNN